MNGVVIAAGQGLRLRPYTDDGPKCMLVVNGRPLITYTCDSLRAAGCSDITIITGHLAERIHALGCRTVHNPDYEHNNVLHSLMYARDRLDAPVLVTYSDILVQPDVHWRLANTPGDIVLAVDADWRPYYEGRTDHPESEAEKAFVDLKGPRPRVKAIGKHLDPNDAGALLCGEFIGLWRMTATGARRFRDGFDAIDARLDPGTAFRAAPQWRKAYVTDLLSELIAEDVPIDALLIERGWAELDTVQDYERLPGIAARQRLALLGYRS